MRAEWQRLRSNDCVDSFTADAVAKIFPRTCFVKRKHHDKREPGLFEEEVGCTEMLGICSKTYCCFDVTSVQFKFSSKSQKSQHTRTGTEWRRTTGRVSGSLERKSKRQFEQ